MPIEEIGDNVYYTKAKNVIYEKTPLNDVRGENEMERNESLSTENRGLIRVAAYIRVSSENEAQLESFEKQETYFGELLERNPGWISAGIYFDYGISATSKKKRTGFKRLLRHCREGKIDRILCKSISRFARNTVDFMEALAMLKEHGVTIFFEKENLDTAERVSAFILATLGAIAQEESRSISENIRWGKEKRYRKGEDQNYALYGYRFCEGMKAYTVMESGYRYKKIEVIEKEAAVVRRIYREFLSGMKMVDIAEGLNRDGVQAPAKNVIARKNRRRQEQYVDWAAEKEDSEPKAIGERGWTAMMIGNVLRMERYTGDALLQKFYVADYMNHKVQRNRGELPQYLSQNHHPGIISRETFRAAQRLLSENPNYGRSSVHRERRFSGILVCAHCGRHYHVRNGENRDIWFCPSTKRHNGRVICSNERVSEETVAYMVRKAAFERFRLSAVVLQNDRRTRNILYGRNLMGREIQRINHQNRDGDCVDRMIARLELFQEIDYAERDRMFIRKELPQLRDGKAVGQSEKMEGYLEWYWHAVEGTFDRREKALEWLKTISEGSERMEELLDGLTGRHIKAFVLSVGIYSPSRFLVHWFDDTTTEVTL